MTIPTITDFKIAAGMPVPPQEMPNAQPDASKPSFHLVDAGPSGNERMRWNLLSSLGNAYHLTPEYLNQVQKKLGLTGNSEVAATRLEAREVKAIIANAEEVSNRRTNEMKELVGDVLAQMRVDDFGKAVDLEFGKAFAVISQLVPSDLLGEAGKLAFFDCQQKMTAHLEQMADTAKRSWNALPPEKRTPEQMKSFLRDMKNYVQTMTKFMQEAAVNPDCRMDRVLATMLTLQVSVGTLSAQMGIFANVIKAEADAMTALNQADAVAGKLVLQEVKARLEEMVDEFEQRLRALEEAIKRLAVEKDEEKAAEQMIDEKANTVIAEAIKRKCDDMEELVAGFTKRVVEATAAKREDITEHRLDDYRRGL